jgi:Na+/H+-dicarboxylate symporter
MAIRTLAGIRRRLSLSSRVFVAIAAGVVTGLFIGERAAVLQMAADAYVRLLQMTVLPYVTLSLIGGLGALSRDQASRLGSRVGLVLVGLWIAALLGVFVLPLMFPRVESASFFSTTLLDDATPFDLIALYIPANPFNALANNIVPAVVLFSALLGIALIGVAGKEPALHVIDILNQGVARVARFVVALTPIGLFAIAAVTAGTLDLGEAAQLEIYLACYLAVSVLLSLWILPGLVAALTPVPHRVFLSQSRDALLMAFATGSVLVALPLLAEQARTLLREHARLGPQDELLPDVIVPAAYNFPTAGKLLSIGFVLFAGWFTGSSISPVHYPTLGAAGVLALFGSVNVAVPFLLDLFRIPADTFQLFLATGVVSARFGTLLSAVHILAAAILGACAAAGALRVDARRLIRFAVVTVILSATVLTGTRLFVGRLARHPHQPRDVLNSMQPLRQRTRPVIYRSGAPPLEPFSGSVLDRVRARGRLRVGYLDDSLPYAFTNAGGDLVGFDVEMAQQLAQDLGVELELVLVDQRQLDPLEPSSCDLVMSGVPVTADRSIAVRFSTPYLDETLAFVVLDHRRGEFATWDAIRARRGLRVAVPAADYYVNKIRAELPQADITVVQGAAALFAPRAQPFDAIALTAERGSAYTLLHPQYTIVVPQPRVLKVPLAYIVAGRDQALANVVDTWIDLKRKDGTIDELFGHWILGRNAAPRPRRWSVLDDVLHWGS